MTTSRTLRLLVVSALATLSGLGTPVAHAVSPPPIDERWLPESALPAPPRPTVQREVCTEVTAESGRAFGRAERSAQLADLDQVWRLTRGAGQRVAVIDTGVARHRRLPKVVAGGDYVFTGDGTADCDAHGTLVAGIIAAAPDAQSDNFSGVAPDVTLISIRQSSSKFAPVGDPSSTGVGDVDTMAKAVRTAADLGASVINISSIACVPAAAAPDDRALGAALAYAVDVKNAVIVAAAGNTGGAAQCPPQAPGVTRDSVTVAVSPAWYDDYVLTVGSVNAQGEPSAFTLAGPWVDVAATGEAVTSLSPFGDGTVNTWRTAWFDSDIRNQLCGAGRQRPGRPDPGPLSDVDRTAGDAAHRIYRASPTRRMGSARWQRHGRCPGCGQQRLDSAGRHRNERPRSGGGAGP